MASLSGLGAQEYALSTLGRCVCCERHVNRAVLRRKLDRVRDDVNHNLADALLVDVHARQQRSYEALVVYDSPLRELSDAYYLGVRIESDKQLNALLVGLLLHRVKHFVNLLQQVDVAWEYLEGCILDLGEVEQIVHQIHRQQHAQLRALVQLLESLALLPAQSAPLSRLPRSLHVPLCCDG